MGIFLITHFCVASVYKVALSLGFLTMRHFVNFTYTVINTYERGYAHKREFVAFYVTI